MARAGDVIGGKYRLTHPLGIGGMGAVWRAEHVALKLQVAVKLLDARGPAAERAVARFQREAQIAASIRHRNIVYISDFGTENGMPYLVMELLNGVPLSERIVVGEPLSVAAFLRLIEAILLGLNAVHEAGVVHRDMKPENIFLVRDGATVLPKLLDFGVSRSTERGQGHTITREGIVMGTPEYIAPEQARGRMADVRSDIYSLGVVVYEALAGRLPFQADNAADLIVAVLNADPIPLYSLRPELGEALSTLVHKAMARKPADRFASAEEMRLAITEFLAATPEAENWLLPKRFLSPSKAPGRMHPDTPTEGEANESPTRAFASPSSGMSIPGLSRRSNRAATAVGLGAIAAGIALMALSLAGGDAKPTPSAAARAPRPTPAETEPIVEPRAAPPSAVTVELFGVPPEGLVLVDGVPIEGARTELVRNSGKHIIEVRAPGREPWLISHDAATDGRYALALEQAPGGRTPAKTGGIKSVKKPTGTAATPIGKSKLLRQPDF